MTKIGVQDTIYKRKLKQAKLNGERYSLKKSNVHMQESAQAHQRNRVRAKKPITSQHLAPLGKSLSLHLKLICLYISRTKNLIKTRKAHIDYNKNVITIIVVTNCTISQSTSIQKTKKWLTWWCSRSWLPSYRINKKAPNSITFRGHTNRKNKLPIETQTYVKQLQIPT